METLTVAVENAVVAEETAVEETAAETQVSMLQFIEAYETSVIDETGYEGCAAKTGLKLNTVKARASKLRNPEFEMEDKLEGDKPVYSRAVTGPNGETETTDKELAKKNTQGKLVKVRVFTLKDGEKVVRRPALSLSDMPATGGRVRIASQVDEAEALLARLRGAAAAAKAAK